MSNAAVADPTYRQTPHARRVKRSRGVLRRQPRAVRIAIGDARSPDAKAKRLGRGAALRGGAPDRAPVDISPLVAAITGMGAN